MEACISTHMGGGNVHDIELLNEIKRKLDQARYLATEAASFTLFYIIELAILEVGEMETQKCRTPPARA